MAVYCRSEEGGRGRQCRWRCRELWLECAVWLAPKQAPVAEEPEGEGQTHDTKSSDETEGASAAWRTRCRGSSHDPFLAVHSTANWKKRYFLHTTSLMLK